MVTLGVPGERIDAVLHFMDVYDRCVEGIDSPLLEIGLSEPEINVLRQLDPKRDGSTTHAIRCSLRMDPAQLSRALLMLRAHRLIVESREPYDRRIKRIRLTPEGERLYASAQDRLSREVREWLDRYSERDQICIIGAMRTLSVILLHRRRAGRAEACAA